MIRPRDQLKVWPATVVCEAGTALVVRKGAPVAVEFERSVRTNLATRTAPSTFNAPAPCSNMLKPLTGWAVYINRALIMFGVNWGFVCIRSAADPATTGVAIE